MTERSIRCFGRLPVCRQLLYRHAMAVVEIHMFPQCHGAPAYPVCPRCRRTMEREYMPFCSRCGQKLDWRCFQYARVLSVEPGGAPRRRETPGERERGVSRTPPGREAVIPGNPPG